MTMRQFADHVISVSNEHAIGISNLQLQKIMYFAIGDYIKDNGIDDTIREIYDEPFLAWPYGPVVESEYHRYKIFGRFYIRDNGEYNDNYEVFDNYIRNYVNQPITDLVEKSHEHSTWYKNRQNILLQNRVEYSLEEIENDFLD